MTGAAHGPERGSPEYRTAKQQKDKTPRQAIKSLHVAERQLLSAQRGDAMARALAEIALQSELISRSRRRALSSHYASKVAALSPSLSKDERHAAMARLKDEEIAATQALELELKHDAATERVRIVTHLTSHYRSLSIGLHQRQRRLRVALTLILRRPERRPAIRRTLPAVRRVASRIFRRRIRSAPPRLPR